MKRYSTEFLLSFAENASCKSVPPNLDPSLLRDSPSLDIVDGGGNNKFVSRRDQELPDWRNRSASSGNNGGGGLLPHNNQPRRRNSEEDGFKGPSSWGSDGGHLRNKPGSQGPAQSRWEHRGSSNDRERDKGPRAPQWDAPEQGDSGSRPRFAWNSSEHDGLLGSGGGLRGPYPGGRTSDRYNNNGGRGTRNNDSRINKPGSGGYRNDFDDLDGETFGEKNSTKDRSEEERRRREEFESMRKEQQRIKVQKKPEKLENSGPVDETLSSPAPAPAPESKPEVSSAPAPASSTPRPLVPPGFNLQKSTLKNDQKEQGAEELTESNEKSPPQAVDPVAIACSINEGDVFTLAENSKANLIDKIFSKSSSSVPAFSPPQPELVRTSSKFAHLFNFEEESSSKQSPSSPESKSPEAGTMLPMPVAPSVEDVEKSFKFTGKLSSSSSSSAPQQQQAAKAFLTCEDIEQSLLAEAKFENETPELSSWKKEPDAARDTNAARHLLSLLQKPAASESSSRASEPEASQETPATLESLFGMSFMMELRSKDAPLSVKAVSESMPSSSSSGAQGLDQSWGSPLWGGKPEKPRMNTLEELEMAGNPPPEANGELDSGVLSDFLKFKKAMNHRNKVNDSFLGSLGDPEAGAPPAAAAGLYRSHSPPLINQRSSLQLQQLKQVLVSQGSKLAAAKQQQQIQQQNVLGNGDIPENRFGRARPQMNRQQQQQQQGMFDPAGNLIAPPQGFPPAMYSSKQRPPQQHHHHLPPAGFFPPNAGVLPPHIAPPGMSFGLQQQQQHHHQHHHHHPHPGFGGVFPGAAAPNEVFMDPAAENRWIGRDSAAAAAAAAAHLGLFQQQQQPGFGMNKLGYP